MTLEWRIIDSCLHSPVFSDAGFLPWCTAAGSNTKSEQLPLEQPEQSAFVFIIKRIFVMAF